MLCWNFEFLIKFQLKTIKYSANLKVIWHILLYKCLHFFILYMQYFSGRKFMIQHNIYFYYKSLKVMPHFTVGNHQKKKSFEMRQKLFNMPLSPSSIWSLYCIYLGVRYGPCPPTQSYSFLLFSFYFWNSWNEWSKLLNIY